MTAYTLTKNTNLRDLTVAGGYSARTGGDTIANTNGWSFTIDQDTQYGFSAPAFAASTAGSIGSITQTAASGGDIFIDGRYVRLIPFNTGSGTLTIDGSVQTIGSGTGVIVGIYTAMNAAPATTGASGWLKVASWNQVDFPTSGAFTKSGFTFTITGASVVGWIEVVGDDAGTFTGNRLGKFQVRGAYYEIGTTDGNRATTYQVPNNGKQLYVPGIEVQGAASTVISAVWSNGVATYTTSAAHPMLVGQPTTVSGISPAGFNFTDLLISEKTDTTFSVVLPDPSASYVSGGTAQSYEKYPCAGTLVCTAANWTPNEDTRRGKAFWNTNATTSLTLPTGVIRFGHDGTNSSGAFCPPAGRKIRVPNVFFTNCTTAARNQNVLPNVTLATRYDFTMTGAGQIDIDKANMSWYLSATQAQAVSLTNSNFMSRISVSELPTSLVMKNVCVGQEAAVTGVAPLTISYCYASGVLHNVVGTIAIHTAAGNTTAWNVAFTNNFEVVDCVGWSLALRSGSIKYNWFNYCSNPKITRFHTIGQRLYTSNCSDQQVVDTIYTDNTGTRNSGNSQPVIAVDGPSTSGYITGLSYSGYRAQNYGAIISVSSQIRGNFKVRNLGTLANPLLTGDGPYYDKAWTRVTTVQTVTHVAHGLLVNDSIVVFDITSTSTGGSATRTVASVPTADTFTFACTNAGDASGTLSYYLCNVSGLFSTGTGGFVKGVTFQRCYPKFARSGYAPDNTTEAVNMESCFATFDPIVQATWGGGALNTTPKYGCTPPSGNAVSVYGSTWSDGPRGTLGDVDTFTWTRSGATVTLTTTSGYHNFSFNSSELVHVVASSDEAALNLGPTQRTYSTTAGVTSNKGLVAGYSTGATSGTATVLRWGGQIDIQMNEGSSVSQDYVINAGNPSFNGSGLLRMPTVDDQITFETPYWIKGHTGFCIEPIVVSTATMGNFNFEYQIDTGSGYSTWKTLYRRTATAVADGTAGAATITQVAAGDNWIADGDYVRTTVLGETRRDAFVASGGGTTTLTMNKTHNTTFANRALEVFRLPSEVIDWETGFKLKVRITTLVAGTGASNTLGTIYFKTFTTAASRALQLPLDTFTLSITGLVSGSDVVVRAANTNTILGSVDSNAGSSWNFVYETPQAVDIDVIKPGYVVLALLRNYTLPSANASLPAAQIFDRNFI